MYFDQEFRNKSISESVTYHMRLSTLQLILIFVMNELEFYKNSSITPYLNLGLTVFKIISVSFTSTYTSNCTVT